MTDPQGRPRTIALTGATGFIGGVFLKRLIKNGETVRILVRSPEKIRSVTDDFSSLTVIEGDLDNQAALTTLVGSADILVHCAGVVTPGDDDAYRTVNVEGAANAANAAQNAGARIIHLSSLSAREPHLSPYAASKSESERAVGDAAISLRLPAIYGPGDMVTLPFFKMVSRGVAPEPATKIPARVSILFVEDAIDAIMAVIKGDLSPGIYEVGDDSPDGHAWSELGLMLGGALGKKPKRLQLPRPLLAAAYGAILQGARLLGRPPSVRTGQINEFFHPDWVSKEPLFNTAANWTPAHSLQEGFAKTVHWYQKNGYLKT